MKKIRIMGIVNLTPDSFWAPSRASSTEALPRIEAMLADGADIIDVGAVSTRPGAASVSVAEEWDRLAPVLRGLAGLGGEVPVSVDTTSGEIVRRVYDTIGPFLVNDISAGEDDPLMLGTVGELGLSYVAMHKRGNPRTMDARCDYPEGVVPALLDYFRHFGAIAADNGISDWILDPGLGFAKTAAQNWEILERLDEFSAMGRPVLIGAADKRFTAGDTEKAHRIAIGNGASILRVHNVKEARRSAGLL